MDDCVRQCIMRGVARQMIVSHQACTSGVDDRTVVDPEAHLPYDMRTETVSLGAGLAGRQDPH